ncbi:hypothetical protein BV881_23355 [Streptomyces sp. ZL-24]|nr:hypothetical protein BV881_23355 [Streptomyces sp. ZL-24]
MAPGLPAVWSSRCAVCLLVAAGSALGPWGPLNPPGGTAHASSAVADGPSAGASPSGTSGTPGASSPAATPVPSLPSSTPSGSVSWSVPGSPSGTGPSSALPSGLLPSGVPGSDAAEPGDGLSPDSVYVDGAEAPADADSPSPSRSASVEVSGSTAPLAGREAGAGKARPGRSLTPLELAQAENRAEREPPQEAVEEADEPDTAPAGLQDFTPPPDAFTDPEARAARALDAAAVRQVQQVSLGTGIALVGLGLAFLAFRLRRVN